MSLKSPFATEVERGAYSTIVYKDGDLCVTEDNVGTVIKEDANAATVIQAAINNNDGAGKVVLDGMFDITAEITLPITESWTYFDKGITLQGYGVSSGMNYTPSTGYAIKTIGKTNYHILDNLHLKAPNTTDGVVGILGGISFLHLNDLKITNSPSGKGVHIKNDGFTWNNVVNMSNFVIFNCKYGIYAEGGPSLFITHRGHITTMTSGGGLEALYYTVDGYTGTGWKQLYTENLSIAVETEGQRGMYVKGDAYFFSSHQDLYTDNARPIYLDGGRHTFHSSYLGEMDWSVGTLVEIDQGCTYCKLAAKDPMYCNNELKTPFLVDAIAPFTSTDGSEVVDGNAANGKCIQLDAQYEFWQIPFIGTSFFRKYIGRGEYLLIAYVKDSNQITNDLKIHAIGVNGGNHDINPQYFTLTTAYTAVPYTFTIGWNDLEGKNNVVLTKATATANTISVDYISLQRIGTDFHQSLGGGHKFMYLPDAGTLPAALKTFRGVIAFQPGASSVADTLKMCMKSAADTYSWKTVVTG